MFLIVADESDSVRFARLGIRSVTPKEYLSNRRYFDAKRLRVVNLSRSQSYQSLGYYVSLLAAARGHRPIPSVNTIQDLRQPSILKIAFEEIEEDVQRLLAPIRSDAFELSVYLGKNLARRYDRIADTLFKLFPVPFMRAEFEKVDNEWRLVALKVLSFKDIAESHHEFILERMKKFMRGPKVRTKQYRYELAILVNPEEQFRPSDDKSIKRFVRAAEKLSMSTTLISRDDMSRIAEFDALFIRETTSVNHHTYRMAAKADAAGLFVIDDPESIIRCSNKVYQAELFEKHNIDTPKTLVLHKGSVPDVGKLLGFPCVIKQPDSCFSAGVMKAKNQTELDELLDRLFKSSELLVAQSFTPSTYDWRIGVLGGKALYACRYYMARGHWQIQKSTATGSAVQGKSDTLAIENAPPAVVELAVKTARLIGNSLYGVDIKEVGDRLLVVEVNDNPSIDSGVEDLVLKDSLYESIMRHIFEQLELRGKAVSDQQGSRPPLAL